MSDDFNLLQAIRSGSLTQMRAQLEAAVLHDPGQRVRTFEFALGLACLYGTPDMLRELVAQGSPLNVGDNTAANTPLQIARRGGKREILLTLIELGAVLPADFRCVLSDEEILAAQAKGRQEASGMVVDTELAGWLDGFEEITIQGRADVDTCVLETDLLRAARRN